MKEYNDWDSFMNSGKVEDYLSYRENSKSINEDNIQLGANPDAGFSSDNGINTTSGSYRGL